MTIQNAKKKDAMSAPKDTASHKVVSDISAVRVAQQLGKLELPSYKLQTEIKRLNKKNVVTLKQVEVLHQW